jgi:hypothetical protein
MPWVSTAGPPQLTLLAQMVSLLYGVFSYCNGLQELSEGLMACEGKLTGHLQGMEEDIQYAGKLLTFIEQGLT